MESLQDGGLFIGPVLFINKSILGDTGQTVNWSIKWGIISIVLFDGAIERMPLCNYSRSKVT